MFKFHRLLVTGSMCLLLCATISFAQVPVDQFVNFESAHVHPLELTPDGNTLLAVNTANNTLEVFAVADDGNLAKINRIPVGHDPVSVRARDNNEVWVANLISDSISIVDLSIGAVVRTLQTQNEPSDIVFAGNDRAFVSCAERESVQVFDLNNLNANPTEVLLIGEQPRAMAVSNDGNTVYVAFFESGNQTTVVPGNDFIANGGLFAPFSGTTIVANDVRRGSGPYGGAVPVPNDGNSFNPPLNPDLPAKTDTQSLVVKKQADGTWRDDNNGDWTNIISGGDGIRSSGWDLQDRDVAIINAIDLSVSYQNTLGNILMAVTVNPSSDDVYVVGTDAMNHIRFEPNLNGTFMRHQLSRFTPGNSAVTITDLNPHLDYLSPTVSNPLKALSVGDPRSVEWQSDGSIAWISSMGTNTVIKIDTNGERVGSPVAVGEGPTGIAIHEGNGTAYVLNKFSGSISSVDLLANQLIGDTFFFDPTPEIIKIGRPHLYNTFTGSGNGTISCASCHVDGKWDRLAWDLGDPSGEMETTSDGRVLHPLKGLKTTQTLMDIISSGLPLHWRGDRDSFRDFHLAFENLKGREPVSEASMAEFEEFIAATYHPPNPYQDATNNNNLLTSFVRGPGTSFQNWGLGFQGSNAIGAWHQACGGCHQNNSGKGPPGALNLRNSQYTNQDNIAADLRMFYRKNGFFHNSNQSTVGFGIFSDGIGQTQEVPRTGYWFDYHGILFGGFPGGGPRGNNFGPEQTPHVSQNSHYRTGDQVTINGTFGSSNEVDQMRNLSNNANVFSQLRQPNLGLVVHGIYQGEQRGFVHTGGSNYQSDSDGETVNHSQLLNAAQANNNEPLTWTLVHDHVATRLGIDWDADGILNFDDTDDSDGDGVPDEFDVFPNDPTESADADGDGIGNNTDDDDDNDGVLDVDDELPLNPSESLDTDADGIGNNQDTDDDGDGVDDSLDEFPLDFDESRDTDGDGIGDNSDSDTDNDGIVSRFEAGGTDFELRSDTIPAGAGGTTVTTLIDLTTQNAVVGQTVTLSDFTAVGDLNGQNEGIRVNINNDEFISGIFRTGSGNCSLQRDVFPAINATVTVIDIGGGTPGLSVMATGTSTTDNRCPDGEGIPGPFLSMQMNGSASFVADFDNDGITNYTDLDSDNDSIPDVVEAGLVDVNGDYLIDDLSLQGTITNLPDTDNDGIANIFDRESNNAANNGTAFDISNTQFAVFDTNNDGTVNSDDTDGGVDANGNGVDDRFETLNPVDPPDPVDPPEPVLPVDNPDALIVIDGNFDDWNAIQIFPADPDDVSGENNVLDINTASLANDADTLYLRMDTYEPMQLSWGLSMHVDIDNDINTGFRGFSGEFPIGVDYMLEANTVHKYTGSGLDFSWDNGTIVPYAFSNNSIEVAIPLSVVGNANSLRLFFFANNVAVNGDATDYAPDALADESLDPSARYLLYTVEGVDPNDPVDPVEPAQTFSNQATIVADGDLSDWSGLTSFGPDPDDVSGDSNRLDWREGWIAHDSNNFYLAWRNDGAAELSWGNGVMFDADQNAATGFRGFSSELPIGVEFLYEANILHEYTGSGTDWSWRTAATITPAIAGNAIEAVISRTLITGTTFNVFFFANNVAVGGTARDFYPDAAGDLGAPVDTRRFRYSTSADNPPNPPSPINILVDGDLSDWPINSNLGSDDADDMTPPDTIDWKSLWATADAQNLYLAYESYDPVQLSWGYGVLMDTDSNPGTGFRGFFNELPIGVDYILEANELNRYTGLSQNEWSWQSEGLQNIVLNGNMAEISIAKSTLGSPRNMQILLKGENVAVNGSGTDLHPDSGSLELTLSEPQNDDIRVRQSLTRPTSAAAQPAAISGGGTMALLGLFILLPLTLWRRVRIASWTLQVAALFTGIAITSACSDSVELRGPQSGGEDTGANTVIDTIPSNNPSFISIPNPAAPSSNASFNLQIAAALADEQAYSAATGSASVTLNRHTGLINGSIRHSVTNSTHAVIYNINTGEGIVLLGKAESNLFRIPAGTRLSIDQINALEAGELFVMVHSMAFPKGEIRAGLKSD